MHVQFVQKKLLKFIKSLLFFHIYHSLFTHPLILPNGYTLFHQNKKKIMTNVFQFSKKKKKEKPVLEIYFTPLSITNGIINVKKLRWNKKHLKTAVKKDCLKYYKYDEENTL